VSLNGTSLYRTLEGDVPALVWAAVLEAEALEFPFCVHPATGRMLQCLAAGLPPGAFVGETGTGTGAGLAWMVSRADPSVRFVSAEANADRAAAAQRVFASFPNVTVLPGDAGDVFTRGPFDLLVHDGGWGSGKNPGDLVDESVVLKEGGLMTIDDFSPTVSWPPLFESKPDAARIYWLTRPNMLATEIRVAPDMALVIARRTTGV
jgi:predicted O-methyltransferase YrrM